MLKLTAPNGAPIYLNPAHIISVTDFDGGADWPGAKAQVTMSVDGQWHYVRETAADIIARLSSPTAANHALGRV